ncbi:MAG: hypothetical protein M0Z77_11620 [Thermoplasmatales archaeon]|jgi:hypothetical protein|nr:hypothetical protein [Candidatus Thermoplasmatota archaeon]MCL6002884.1 hypothetical protein [Candidatus Thermoplasmatota archaeon]MDA8056276.1 hypothetical protein [Thermoplasmatales archaeon]
MNRVDLSSLDSDTSFKIKMEAYLYVDAGRMLEVGKGDPRKLKAYMEKRIGIIEQLLNISRPFRLVEGDDTLLEVGQ